MPDPLVFRPPDRSEHVGAGGGPPAPRTPSPGAQGARLSPQFQGLQEALDGERAQLLDAGLDVDPELIAVFDIIGTVEEFYRAVARIEGLEFLADFEEDDLAPDDDFYWEKD